VNSVDLIRILISEIGRNKMITCSVCGHINSPERAICEECGSDLSDSQDWGIFDDDEIDDDSNFDDDEFEDDDLDTDDDEFNDDNSNFDDDFDDGDLNFDESEELGYIDPDFYD
jgi:hypothetical protein